MEVLSVRFKPSTKKWLETKAKEHGIKMASFVRWLVEVEELKEKLNGGNKNETN